LSFPGHEISPIPSFLDRDRRQREGQWPDSTCLIRSTIRVGGPKSMSKIMRGAMAGVTVIGLMLGAAASADAKTCVKKGAIGEAGSEKDAKFQVAEALLQAVDWGAWASWMANGTTPGYTFGPRTYRCQKGGSWGWTCRGQATICKL
jgi:hypothetical protein